ncbi:hypothetical protein Q4610_20860 [Sphingobium sp. HBC34]|uniref:Uncharacterized protein n=1 Tax=Sphingobium cyanobacteriorum TaxID=3063954 RepID=A0ABT8ZSH9_9SPHN|nr:hypothetical protein [Sphingobium sp. HBC34]MDO7837496.1 hypothetical protein [Sphingobium sp. HBC34]
MDNRAGLTMTIVLIVVVAVSALARQYLARRDAKRIADKRWAITPMSIFQHHPGRGVGYAGYTDHAAMGYEVNDSLLWQSPEMQFELVGFAKGFLEGILSRDGLNGGQFQIIDATSADRDALGWLALMQRKGTDNAAPSTDNLATIITLVARELNGAGPLRIPYWEKFQSRAYGNPRKESRRRSRTSIAKQEQLLSRYERRRKEGYRLARSAIVA